MQVEDHTSRELADEIGLVRDEVARSVTETFLARHPDWLERYGDRARTHGVKDAGHHLDFLRTAVDLADPGTFAAYASWCRDLLGARGIGEECLVEILDTIGAELAERLSRPAAEAAAAALTAGVEALAAGGTVPPEETSLSPACRLFLAAAVSGRRGEALAIVRALLSDGASPMDVYVDVFQQALHEVGRRWQATELTVAEEHMATATTQYILGVLHEDLVRTAPGRGVAVVTGVLDELHVVGANIVADALEADGWDVRFLGSNLPHGEIVSTIEQHRASLVAVSVTLSRWVPRARELIALIRQNDAVRPRIIVGGSAFRRDPDLWRTIGADGFCADVRGLADLTRG